MTRMRKIVCTLLFGLLLVAGAAAQQQAPAQQQPPRLSDIEVIDLKAQPAKLATVLGKATVLNFWATWCRPCRMEMPELQKVYDELASKGLAVLAVNVDGAGIAEDQLAEQVAFMRPRIEEFARSAGISLPIYLVDQRTQAELGVDRIPMTVLLDGKGQVVRVYPGFSEEGMRDLREQIATLLATGPRKAVTRKGGK